MDPQARKFIVKILESANDLTLATVRRDGYPQANTVSYASDGLVVYFGGDAGSAKLRNIRLDERVSLTVDLPYRTWNDIRGLSMGAIATVLPHGSVERAHAIRLLMHKFPQLWKLPPPVEPEAIAIVRIAPKVVSMLDYRRGFGFTELVKVRTPDLVPVRVSVVKKVAPRDDDEDEALVVGQVGGPQGISRAERLGRVSRRTVRSATALAGTPPRKGAER